MVKYIKELYDSLNEKEPSIKEGDTLTIQGSVRSNRGNKEIGFLGVNDGSCFNPIQVVYNPATDLEAGKAKLGEAVIVTGTFHLTPEMKQPFELHLTEFKVAGLVDDSYPLQKKKTSYEYLRTMPQLRMRTNTFNAVFRIRSEASYAIHEYFHNHGFYYIHTPIFTGDDCEGAGQTFRVVTNLKEPDDFFGKPASLTVSGQLHVEPFAMAYEKVYTFGPTFRAEKSNTQRHAAEFWMIEPEIAFADINDDMDLMEDFLKFVVKRVMECCSQDIKFFETWVDKNLSTRLNDFLTKPFTRVNYTEGIKILQEAQKNGHKFQYPDIHWGIDLMSEHERYLTEEHFKGPIFLTDYPKDIKAFYMKQNPDGKTVAAVDLLLPEVGELCGGSQREEDYDKLLQRMKDLNMNIEGYQWYLDLRRYGGCVHSGFGLGFDRLLMFLTGIQNIRDVQPYPRTYKEMQF